MTLQKLASRRITALAVLASVLVLTVATVVAAGASTEPAWGSWQSQDPVRTLEVDIAEDMTRFIYNEDVVYEDGLPKHGSSFVTMGYIYPKGTLDGTNGVLPDGSPEFPDQVIGEWSCFGYMINDAAHQETGAWVLSTQVFDLGLEAGSKTLVSTGYELIDFDVPVDRAVVGGTGMYDGASGTSTQTLLGLNATEGVNLSVSFEVETN